MTKADALAQLRAHEPDLRAIGIQQLSLFGSVARDEASSGSDVDLAAELDRSKLFGLMRLVQRGDARIDAWRPCGSGH